jgi:hypothetical protein
MSINKWSFKVETHALADTGDYDSNVQFISNNDILQTCGDEVDEDDCQKFCDLLNLMPDLWSHRCDNAEFMKCQFEEEHQELKNLVLKLKSENMVSVVGEELIDGYLSRLFF